MKSIVDGYVRLANRTALEGLIAHHRQLLKELDAQAKASEADLTAPMVKVIEEEMAIIDLGLERLAAR